MLAMNISPIPYSNPQCQHSVGLPSPQSTLDVTRHSGYLNQANPVTTTRALPLEQLRKQVGSRCVRAEICVPVFLRHKNAVRWHLVLATFLQLWD